LGLLSAIVATGCPPISRVRFDLGDFPLERHSFELDGVAWGYGPGRASLDKILIEGASAAGAKVAEGLAVDAVLFDDGHVVGVRTAGPHASPRDSRSVPMGNIRGLPGRSILPSTSTASGS